MFTKSQLEEWRGYWDLSTSGNCWHFSKQTNKFPRIGGLQNQRVAAGYGIVFPRTAGTCEAPDCHGFQPNQPKRLMPTVRPDDICAPEEHPTTLCVQWGTEAHNVSLFQVL